MSDVYHCWVLSGKYGVLQPVPRDRRGSRCNVIGITVYYACAGLCIGTPMEARRRSSLSSHSRAIQSLMARQKAAERSSLKIAGAPWRALQMV
ncbi:MAG TPA: hypothetical protein VND19_16130 [Acetobacteraceae bacterium]|nr:hypothetical protein [Acetobacteraceae bacterium]